MSDQITMEALQELARRGKLRARAFGEHHLFGVHMPFRGDLERAAASLPGMFETGTVALYRDDNGLFVGPSNSRLIDTDPFADCAYEEEDDQ